MSEHGIATTDLADPKLTHIVVSRLVPDRYVELVRRTNKCVRLFLSPVALARAELTRGCTDCAGPSTAAS